MKKCTMNKRTWAFLIGGVVLGWGLVFLLMHFFLTPEPVYVDPDDGLLDLGVVVRNSESFSEDEKDLVENLEQVSKVARWINVDKGTYDIQLPLDRTSEEMKMGEAEMVFLLPPASVDDGFGENISVMTEFFNGSIEEYVDLSVRNMNSMIPGLVVTQTGSMQVNEYTVTHFSATYTMAGKDIGITIYMFFENSIAYLFTHGHSSLSDSLYEEEVQEILKSFSVIQ